MKVGGECVKFGQGICVILKMMTSPPAREGQEIRKVDLKSQRMFYKIISRL
jgi:hypothetical protein